MEIIGFLGSRVPVAAQINKKPVFLWLPELSGLWNYPETIGSLVRQNKSINGEYDAKKA